jgi:hypothetical protein
MSSSEKRTIKINPELFKFSDKNTSRKKRSNSDLNIKVKPNEKKPVRNKTLRRNVMKMIREKQMEEYKNLFGNGKKKDSVQEKPTKIEEFKTDFENSLKYFENLSDNQTKQENQENQQNKENQFKKNIHNSTFKRQSDVPIQTQQFFENTVSNILPDVFNDVIVPTTTILPMQINKEPFKLPAPPKYGCLKNGSLPTYRRWTNSTQRNYGGGQQNRENLLNQPIQENLNTYSAPLQPTNNNNNNHINDINNINGGSTYEKQTILSEMKKDLLEKKKKLQKKKSPEKSNQPRLKYMKRKKIYNRTYHLGRSKIAPKIGVLVSNKTIRQRISTNALQLKQTPMPEVKKFLVKKGFIKVGSLAPNDVLRQLYETANLICGEIENHNPENLLFNYFNSNDKT